MAAMFILNEIIYHKETRRIRKINTESAKRKKSAKRQRLEERMCRACGGVGHVHIFGARGGRSLARDMRECCGIEADISDGLPAWLCGACVQLVRGAVRFRDMCRESARAFRRWRCDAAAAPDDDDLPLAAHALSSDDKDNGYAISDLSTATTPPPEPCEPAPPRPKSRKQKVCDICGKTYPFSVHLKRHYASHFNVFPYKCQSCPYRSRTEDLLKTHTMCVHLDKRYQCQQCGNKFSTCSNLKRHILVNHTPQDVKQVQCHLCSKTLRDKDALSRHVKNYHAPEPSICSICGKQFTGPNHLANHRRKVHHIKLSSNRAIYLRIQEEETDSRLPLKT